MEGLHVRVSLLGRDGSGGLRMHGAGFCRVPVGASAGFVEGWTPDEEEPLEEPEVEPEDWTRAIVEARGNESASSTSDASAR